MKLLQGLVIVKLDSDEEGERGMRPWLHEYGTYIAGDTFLVASFNLPEFIAKFKVTSKDGGPLNVPENPAPMELKVG